jgi:probable F420-dependent oxidoreductase
MKFGVMYANLFGGGSPVAAAALCTAAEAAGFDSLWTSDHVVMPVDYSSRYPYDPSGKAQVRYGERIEDLDLPDPLLWLAHAAACSSTLLLGTAILILPERNPLVVAKQVATLDVLCGGRTRLGVGVGWLREEYAALGVPWERRGERLDSAIETLRALWTGQPVRRTDGFVDLDGVICRPVPVQPRLPIVIGGHTEAAARRAGRLGDGFFPGPVEDLPGLLQIVRDTARSYGRDPDAIEVTVGGVGCVGRHALDNVKGFADQGVHRITVPPLAADPDTIGDALARYRDDVMSPFLD